MEDYSQLSVAAFNSLSQARDSLSAVIEMMQSDEEKLGTVSKETARYALSAVKSITGVIQQSPKQIRALRACLHASSSTQPSAE